MKKGNINVLTMPDMDRKTKKELNIVELTKTVFESEEQKTLRVNSTSTHLRGLLDGHSENIVLSTGNNDLITEKIKLNKILNDAIEELSRVYEKDDELLKYIVRSTEFFVKNLVDKILDTEINYLNHLEKIYRDSGKNLIEGEFLSFDLKKEKFSIKEKAFNKLLDEVGIIVSTYSTLLRMKNSEWLEEYFKQHKSHLDEKNNFEIQRIISSRENLSESERLKAEIKKIKDDLQQEKPNKKISVRVVAQKLNIPDSTFRDQLKKHGIDFSKL